MQKGLYMKTEDAIKWHTAYDKQQWRMYKGQECFKQQWLKLSENRGKNEKELGKRNVVNLAVFGLENQLTDSYDQSMLKKFWPLKHVLTIKKRCMLKNAH